MMAAETKSGTALETDPQADGGTALRFFQNHDVDLLVLEDRVVEKSRHSG